MATAMRTRLMAAALALALGPALAGCLGFGDSGEDETPPPETKLKPNVEQRKMRPMYGNMANTWQGGADAAAAAKASKGPLDKSPTAFPAPRTDLPSLPTAQGAGQGAVPAGAAGLPSLPGAGPAPGTIPRAPSSMTAAAAAPAPQPQPRRPAALPAGVNAAAEGAPILDVFRRDKIGPLVSRADDLYAERSAQLAMEYSQDGAARGWSNPETGTAGAVRPTRTFQQPDGGFCREFALSIEVRQKPGGETKGAADAAGRYACRQANGRWKFLP
jgi:surface antigen